MGFKGEKNPQTNDKVNFLHDCVEYYCIYRLEIL